MAKDAASKFIGVKDDVVINLDALQNRVNECIDLGMLDNESILYNEIYTLLEDVGAVHTYPELAEIIIRGQEIEHNIDAWMSGKGFTTISLDWPDLPKGT